MVDDDEPEGEDWSHPTEEECAKEGHCICFKSGGANCCRCGHYDAARAKVITLDTLKQNIIYAYGKYPGETIGVLKGSLKNLEAEHEH